MYFWKYILAKKAGLSQKKCNMALYGLPVLPIAEAFEKTLTGNPITITDALAQDALSLQVAFTPTQDGTPSIDSEPTTEPYLSKVIPRGNKEYYSLVGGTVAWNQLTSNGDFSNGTTDWAPIQPTVTSLSVANNEANLTVTQTTSALNYGIALGRSTTAKYNIYAEHKYLHIVKFCASKQTRIYSSFANNVVTDSVSANVWTNIAYIFRRTTTVESTGYLGIHDPSVFEVGDTVKFKNWMVVDLTLMFANNPAIADYAYSLEQSTAGSGIAWLRSYGFFTKDYYPYNPGELISVNTSGHKIGSTTYSIDPTDLRGLFKLDSANKLYCDGDTYKSNGTVTRNFEYRAYQSGDESLADAITDGTHTVVKLTTPTTESATPYTSPIDVEAGGTEEFVDSRTVPIPVGNETYYASEYAVHGKTSVSVDHSATSGDTPTTYTVSLAPVGENIIPYDLDNIKSINNRGEWDGDTYTWLGISYAFQSDGSVILNGTATGGSGIWYWMTPLDPIVPLHIPEGYILSGVSGGGLYTYSLDVDSLRCYDPEVLSERNAVTISIDVLRNTTVNNMRIKPAITPPVYGGTVDIVSGVLTVTWGYIASYNGETLTGRWLSSKDVYVQGTTPSTGAEVAYELATPLTYELTPQQVQMLLGNNYLVTEDGTITITYMARR